MSSKLLRDFAILSMLFLAIWGVFSWLSIAPSKESMELSIVKEEELGELIIDNLLEYDPNFKYTQNEYLDSVLTIISERLISNLDSTEYSYKIRLIDSEQINAVTFPGGNIFVFTGLLNFSNSAEEVAAVISHEIGHVEQRHVINKLIKEFSIGVLFSILTGGDASVIIELSKTMLSTVFDRQQETDADMYGVELMMKSGISPNAMTSFFMRLDREYDINENLEFVMTHPHNKSRIETILEQSKNPEYESRPFNINWEKVKQQLE